MLGSGPEFLSALIVFLGGLVLWYLALIVMLVVGIRWVIGRRRLAGAALLAVAFGIYVLPSLIDQWQLRQTVRAMERAQLIRNVPDLTGKVVVLAPARDLDDLALDCQALMQDSGARIVYLTHPFRKDHERDAVDLSVAVDLESLIVGRARLVKPDGGYSGDYRRCELVPGVMTEPPDYLLMSGAYNELAARHFRDRLSAEALRDRHVSMLWYMAPITDPAMVLVNEDQADLLLFRSSGIKPYYPYNPMISPDYVDIPANPGSLGHILRPIFCRHGDQRCHFEM